MDLSIENADTPREGGDRRAAVEQQVGANRRREAVRQPLIARIFAKVWKFEQESALAGTGAPETVTIFQKDFEHYEGDVTDESKEITGFCPRNSGTVEFWG